jgi:hypothetical protein
MVDPLSFFLDDRGIDLEEFGRSVVLEPRLMVHRYDFDCIDMPVMTD